MRFKNPIPKEQRVDLEELVAFKKALVKKGAITQIEIDNEKSNK